MRLLIIPFLLLGFLAAAQTGPADTIFVLAAEFGSSTVLTDSTFRVSSTHPSDQLGQAYLPTKIQIGYYLFDAYGRRYRVKAIVSANFGESQLDVVELQDNNIAPSGVGIVHRKPADSDCIPEIPGGNTGLAPATLARIHNHNVANGCGGGGGSGDQTAAQVDIDTILTLPAATNVQNALEEAGANINALAGLIPTAVSDLTNDVPFVSAATLTDSLLVVRDSLAAIRADIGTGGGGGGTVNTIVAGTGIGVDATDPANPIVTNALPESTTVSDTPTIDLTLTGSNISGTVVPGSIGATELTNTAVIPATYTNATITLDADGRATAASSGVAGYGIDLVGNLVSVDTNEVATQNDISLLLGTSGYIPKYTSTGTINSVMREGTSNIGINVSPAASRQLHIHNPDGAVTYAMLTNNASGTGANDGFQFVLVGSNISLINREPGGMDFRVSDSNYFLRATAGGDVSFTGNAAQYKVDIGTTGVIRLPNTTTATRGIGRSGYTSWNTTTAAYDLHDGTSFGRLYPHTDVTPTNGQVPIFNSTTGMYTPTTPTYLTSEVDGSVTNELPTYTSSATAPVSPKNGDVWLNTTTSERLFRLGGVWRNILNGNAGFGNINEVTLSNLSGAEFFDEDGDGQHFTLIENAGTGDFEISGGGFANPFVFSSTGAGANDVQRGSNITTALANRAIATTVTANRPAMWSGTGNELTAFPLESVGGLIYQTQVTGFGLAQGSTANRPSATTPGRIRWNTDNTKPEISDGTTYQNIATETFVDERIVDNSYSLNSDVSIFPLEAFEYYTMECNGSATQNPTLTLPTASALYGGKSVVVWSIDTSGSWSNEISAATIQNGATISGSPLVLGNYQSTTVTCILVGASSWRWVVQNQY